MLFHLSLTAYVNNFLPKLEAKRTKLCESIMSSRDTFWSCTINNELDANSERAFAPK